MESTGQWSNGLGNAYTVTTNVQFLKYNGSQAVADL